MRNPKIIISGGGTGGHVFPAIAIANAIREIQLNAEILFVGAKGRMEMEKVPEAGYKIEGLWISGLQRKNMLKNLSFPFKLISSLLKARSIIKKFNPDVAVGVGGYASGPLLYVAAKMGVPSLIQEQNSFAGITNIKLGKLANRICVAYDGMEKFFPNKKIVLTGNPVRSDLLNIKNNHKEAYEYFGLNPNKKTLLIIGGSLGARTINLSISSMVNQIADAGWQAVWQTGKNYYPQIESRVAEFKSLGIMVLPFISRMDYAYSVADLVISRAGAISVSELGVCGKASVLVPSPNVAEDHQTKNALALVNHQAAILVKDKDAVKELPVVFENLIANPDKIEILENNIKALGIKNSSQLIAEEVLKLIPLKP